MRVRWAPPEVHRQVIPSHQDESPPSPQSKDIPFLEKEITNGKRFEAHSHCGRPHPRARRHGGRRACRPSIEPCHAHWAGILSPITSCHGRHQVLALHRLGRRGTMLPVLSQRSFVAHLPSALVLIFSVLSLSSLLQWLGQDVDAAFRKDLG